MMTYELDDIEKEALLGAVIDRARADLNDGRPLTEMGRTTPMTEEAQELQRDAAALAYTAIRFSGLYRELTSDEWEALAEKLGALAVRLIQDEINVELTRREAENQEMDTWLAK
jgi:hypothetical protein